MTVEQRINEEITKLHEKYERLNGSMQNRMISDVDRTRLELYDLINDYAKKDNTISLARINALLRELDDVEQTIYVTSEKSMRDIVDETSEMTALAISALLVAIIGANAFSENRLRTIRNNVRDSVFDWVGPDNLNLDARLRRLAGTYNDEVRRLLRTGILQGRSVNEIVRDIKSVYDGEEWKIRRLVISEGNTAHRMSVGESADKSGVVEALRLIPGIKRSKGCVSLAEEDRHGMGKGIFLPTDYDIYHPHPQCTSYLEYVIKDEYLTGRGGR